MVLLPFTAVAGLGDSDAVTDSLQVITAPEAVLAQDAPNDNGGRIVVSWRMGFEVDALVEYRIYRSESADTGFRKIADVTRGTFLFNDNKVQNGTRYYYTVAACDGAREVRSAVSPPAQATPQWFDTGKTTALVLLVLICGMIIALIRISRRGKSLYVRRIAGLTAVEEAIGRATEMGRPLLFVPGIMDLDNVQTLAGLTILHRVAGTVAEYDTRLQVPCSRSLVMTTAREVVKEACLAAGRPDAYHEDSITYLTDEQFGYVAGVNGLIVREKPATVLYMGAFYAESLILAETGNSIGAIQIAGTAMPSQLPFFVVACDYTLMGEELFAASAYLSGDPKQLGSLKGQDFGKLIAMTFIIAGSLCATIANLTGSAVFKNIADILIRWFTV
jgi:hypothetical protein